MIGSVALIALVVLLFAGMVGSFIPRGHPMRRRYYLMVAFMVGAVIFFAIVVLR